VTSPAPVLPRATVVICVYTEKRWDDIVAAVGSVQAQDVRAAEVLVVVDHNPALLDRARQTFGSPGSDGDVLVLPNAHRQGLSGARNTAVAAASGDVVVFLDDDAAARPGWLGALLAPYADPDVVGVGGVAHPVFPEARPGLLPTGGTTADATGELDWVVGCTYTGQPTTQAEVRNLMGCNMSVRREVFARVGGFAEDLGRIGRNPLGCEETEFCIRVSQHRPDWTFVFEPRAVIWHRVSAARERFDYFRSRCFAEGLSKAAVTRSVGIADGLSVERRYTTRTLTRGVARGLGEALRGDRAGIERSSAISVGLLAAAAGYARAGVSLRRRPAMRGAK